MNRRLLSVLAVAVLGVVAGCDSLGRAVAVPVHLASHQLCSAVFVGGLDADGFYRDGIAPQIAPLGGLITYRVDRAAQAVTADLAGLVVSRAVYRGAIGCQIDHGGDMAPLEIPATTAPRSPIAGPEPVTPSDSGLAKAMDMAFAETEAAPYRATKAVVILHDGKVIAERYAPGYGVETPMIGWSMTKSVTNALAGILVRQGRLSLVQSPFADPADPRHGITVEHLLRMTSGLDFGQSLRHNWASAFDPSTQMEFDAPDMAAEAAAAPLAAAPGTTWTYSNGNTMLLARMIRDAVGGDAAAVLRFAERELFDKLGLEHPVLEFDGTGTPVGCSHMWATARDWARFAELYLDDGVVAGERLLPEGWVAFSARPTSGSENYGYGAGFWTNRGTGRGAAIRIAGGMPPDAFMARGNQGQYAIVVPSARLVVVRLGMAFTERDDMDAVAHLVGAAVEAVK
ncbi:serine hydrolase domain-containing protein [Zavarzinia sp.]|uniref:serine hydrolase domain-containing protein n=1 Tax=Zavarzinia sp. TaxID=2027920 RepID=UPI00356818B9